MIGNFTQRRRNIHAHVLPFDLAGRAAGPSARKVVGDAVEYTDLPLRTGLAALFWINLVMINVALERGYFSRIPQGILGYMPFVLVVLSTPVIFYCGYPMLRTASLGLRKGALCIESLLSLGVLSAYFFSVVQTFRGTSHLYFDTASVIVTLFLAGKLLESNANAKTSRWITLLRCALPKQVRQFFGGHERFVSITALNPSHSFTVKIGERFAADGIVERGESSVDESLLTGNAEPVAKGAGDSVLAGSVNLNDVLFVTATRTGPDTSFARIITLLERALADPSPLERTVARFTRIFVPAVALLALATFGLIWLGGRATFGVALMRAVTVLVIACPCALVLSTPSTIRAALGSASRRGILITDAWVLQLLGRVNHLVLDKTGTVTSGNLHIVGCELVPISVPVPRGCKPMPQLPIWTHCHPPTNRHSRCLPPLKNTPSIPSPKQLLPSRTNETSCSANPLVSKFTMVLASPALSMARASFSGAAASPITWPSTLTPAPN